jgi:parallel beta-helix repeat protein
MHGNLFVRLCFAAVLLMAAVSPARTWYVSQSAAANGDGSLAAPFIAMQDAEEKTNPGDTVSVMNGTYHNVDTVGNVVTIHRSGTPSKWIVFRAFPGHHPKCKFFGPNGIHLASVRYIIVDGFEIEGNADSVTYDYAWSQRTNLDNPLTTGSGIGVNDYFDSIPQHIVVRNCTIYKCSGGGISLVHADWVTVENNTVHHCTYWSPYAPSGISCYEATDADADTGVKIIIRSNKSYDNQNFIPFYYEFQTITDGNGIIIDDSKNTQAFGDGAGIPYHGKMLVQNNLVYGNGGVGILVFLSKQVVVSNNTSYCNCRTPSITGEIFPNLSDTIVFVNNILCASPGKSINNNWNSTAIYYDYNIYNRDSGIDFRGAHSIVADPLFLKPDTAGAVDFHLRGNSPAIDMGTALYAPATDADGVARPQGKGVDIGAYEYVAAGGVLTTVDRRPSKQFPLPHARYLLNGKKLTGSASARAPVSVAPGRTMFRDIH